MISVHETLELDLSPADAVRIVPVQLGFSQIPVRKPYGRDALEFSPAPRPELLTKPHDVPNSTADSDRFDLPDPADNLKVQSPVLYS